MIELESRVADAPDLEPTILRTNSAVYRENWPDQHVNGKATFTLWRDIIHPGSAVFISASEVRDDGTRLIGNATYVVENVAPQAGYVWFQVDVQWGSPLRISTDILVINP
jgi:hypothetical protein